MTVQIIAVQWTEWSQGCGASNPVGALCAANPKEAVKCVFRSQIFVKQML